MAKTFTFTVPAPAGLEVAPTHARLYSSASLSGAKTLEETVTLASLGYIGTPPETLNWTVDSVDGTAYYWLYLVTAGVEGAPVVLLPEAPAGTVDVMVWTETAIGAVVQGVTFRATPVRHGGGAASPKTIIKPGSAVTDASGYATLRLYADSGEYKVELVGYASMQLDTEGLSGFTINFADEI